MKIVIFDYIRNFFRKYFHGGIIFAIFRDGNLLIKCIKRRRIKTITINIYIDLMNYVELFYQHKMDYLFIYVVKFQTAYLWAH